MVGFGLSIQNSRRVSVAPRALSPSAWCKSVEWHVAGRGSHAVTVRTYTYYTHSLYTLTLVHTHSRTHSLYTPTVHTHYTHPLYAEILRQPIVWSSNHFGVRSHCRLHRAAAGSNRTGGARRGGQLQLWASCLTRFCKPVGLLFGGGALALATLVLYALGTTCSQFFSSDAT